MCNTAGPKTALRHLGQVQRMGEASRRQQVQAGGPPLPAGTLIPLEGVVRLASWGLMNKRSGPRWGLVLGGRDGLQRGEVSPVTPQVTRASGMCQMAAECCTTHPHLWLPGAHACEVKHHSGRLTCVIWHPLAPILQQGPRRGGLPHTTVAEVRRDRER